MPWKKNKKKAIDEEDIPGKQKKVGVLEFWHERRDNLNDLRYQKIWEVPFKSQAICLRHNREIEMIAVGLDNGGIFVVEWNIEDPDQYKSVIFKQIHQKRVMTIWFDPKRKHLYSVGEDKYLKVYDLAKKDFVARKR
jgi:WD40 repeat protein